MEYSRNLVGLITLNNQFCLIKYFSPAIIACHELSKIVMSPTFIYTSKMNKILLKCVKLKAVGCFIYINERAIEQIILYILQFNSFENNLYEVNIVGSKQEILFSPSHHLGTQAISAKKSHTLCVLLNEHIVLQIMYV